jgi:arylsulfatase A-like enzyme
MTSTDRHPNILVIMTDQQSASALSCAGNSDLRTPAIDSLAAMGTRFTQAYCTSPLCSPSRASMITGRMPSELGVGDNVKEPGRPYPQKTLGRAFTDAGYDCAYAGKWHIPGLSHAAEPASGFREIFEGTHHGLAEACGTFLAEPERQDTPFLLMASLNEPHGICEWARGQSPPSGDVDDVDWRDLPTLPPNFAPGTEEPEALRQIQQFAWTVHPTQQWDEHMWRRYRHAYFRLCERADAEIGKMLRALESSGLRESTLIVFTSDHGDMQGAHRWNQKKIMYEEAAGVPFIVAAPGGATPANRDDLVSVGLDLLPTLCDYAGIEGADEWRGRSVRPLIDAAPGADPPWRDHVVAETEWTFPGLMPPPVMAHLHGRMLRTARYKYICHSWGRHREQLFDLQSDPGEMINLATSGAHQGMLSEHRRVLARHCDGLGDDFFRFVPSPNAPPR